MSANTKGDTRASKAKTSDGRSSNESQLDSNLGKSASSKRRNTSGQKSSNSKHRRRNNGFKGIQTRKDQFGNSRKAIYSAIDLGTNNCRLLIAKPTANGFRVIDAFSRIVRLGEGLESSGMLSEAAMDRTIDALKICAEKLARRGVTTMHHVATEACRVAKNSDEFIKRVKQETGINIDVISAADEARLAVMGCQSLISRGNRHALVFDIGGGSTELIWVSISRNNKTEIKGWTSVPWGVVNLSEKYGTEAGDISAEDYRSMVNVVYDHILAFEEAYKIRDIVKRSKVQFLGTSGTVTTLASLHMNLARYDRSKVDGAWMQARDIRRLSNEVAAMTYAERSAQPCIGEERADLVVAGCAIIEAVLGMWPVNSLRVADRGIREGILRNLMQRDQAPNPQWRQNRNNANRSGDSSKDRSYRKKKHRKGSASSQSETKHD
ncbi:Ppx/GppA phosphatase family protein [Temperatibacter marinus]|uniref:Ppx/GppA phosphatase family protein n=1 Tax=Temperatibacter marinus TaxID=1456591 RepID=A0AA52EB94_9PROT|nr:Ppx/GppA phosphatase family protein [Temperatibacter marinus]WND02162.1 Ppx/GppA phosphatase family protein [Temperatibacter marinus]